MKVLITGATGFIGRRITRRLQASGHTVSATARDPERAAPLLPGVEMHRWSAGAAIPVHALDGVDAIVNLAGESVNGRWGAAKKTRILESRTSITRALVDAMIASGRPRALVSASAVGVYGDRGDEVLTEASSPGGGFLKDVVLAWEGEARRAERYGNRVALMRFGIVLGPEGGAMQKLLPLAKLGISGPLGSGKQWWPWVHADDVTRALEMALHSSMTGTYNVVAPGVVQQKEFAAMLGRVLRRPAFLPAPALALRLVQGEFADELLFSKRVTPAALTAAGFQFDHPELESALRQLTVRERQTDDLPALA